MRRILLVTAALLAGCGTADGPRVPTARQPAPAASAVRSQPPETDYDKALRYTRCMTENGAAHPDPVVGEALVTYNLINIDETKGDIGKLAALMQLRREAHEKCQQFLPATWPIKEDPAETIRSRAFRECLRGHGLDAPEPDASGLLYQPTDFSRWSTPEYQAAEQACRHLVDDPATRVDS